ncbi:MAG: ABC transporter ATP-binding protein [Chloroflexota bacterium]|nr:ABC transporter ATP-binding protein [Chloroflexota bacterium]
MLNVHIEKRLGDFTLATDFEIGPQVLVLFGPSGAGKTLTLNCLAGLVTPDRGAIHLGNRVLFDRAAGVNLPARARRVGYVFQDYALFPHLTVRENISFGVRGAVSARVDEMLTLTRLGEFAARYPAQLSGGQQQRVALARALVTRPDLLLLDEPFSALDAPTRMELRRELLDLQREFKIPTVFVTHDLGEAYFLADRLAVIDRGKILQVDSPGDILRRPCCLQVARALGVKNILPGTVIARDGAGSRVRVGEVVIDAPSYPFAPGTSVHVCLRPERVMLLRPERAGRSSDENALPGEIIREMNDGMNATLYFRAQGARLIADAERDYDLQIELPVYIYERLDLAHRRQWTVSLRKNAIHLIGD